MYLQLSGAPTATNEELRNTEYEKGSQLGFTNNLHTITLINFENAYQYTIGFVVFSNILSILFWQYSSLTFLHVGVGASLWTSESAHSW